MPELPEVETSRRGIEPHLTGKHVARLLVRERRLRWPVPDGLEQVVAGQRIHDVSRRAKYLLIRLDRGTLILHLGMSGSLRVCRSNAPIRKHDHVDLVLEGGNCLRLHDPRRFGALLFTEDDPARHALLDHLGPEPLGDRFDGDHLWRLSRARRVAVKNFIMDSRVVVGVGNIYASEALFRAGIRPGRSCRRIARPRYAELAHSIRQVLTEAIEQGGTTLRDFVRENGRPGYFVRSLQVYGHSGDPCQRCGTLIRQKRIGQRSSFYCPRCQG